MADASGLRRLVTEYGGIVQDKAATSMVNRLSGATPRITGRLERARRRSDTFSGGVFSSLVEQPPGAEEPDALPNWLDEGTQFVIRAKRGGVLRFRGRGGAIVFARQVLWRPRPTSVGFWSKNMTQQNWSDDLDRAAASTTVGPS